MSSQESHLYEFGSYTLIPAERLLLRAGKPVALTPKAFETLLVLVRRAGRLVEKSELLAEVWPDTSVEESNVAQNIFTLRRLLSSDGDGTEYIETVPKRGYRFLAPVTVLENRVEPAFTANGHASDASTPIPNLADTQPDANVIASETTRRASPPTRSRKGLVGLLGIAVLLGGVSFFAARLSSTPAAPQLAPRAVSLTRLMTSDSRIPSAAISPDGRYFAHVIQNGEGTAILLRQVSTITDLEIVPLERGAWFCALSFSPDGDLLYYVKATSAGVSTLNRVSTLGGTPQKVLTAIDSHAALSPDGKQLAFVRELAPTENALVLAATDGTNERILARRRRPLSAFSASDRGGPAWSPDGSTIATGVISLDGGYHGEVVTLSVSDGSQKSLTSHRWHQVAQVAWLADGSGLIVTAREPSGSAQIWHVAYPGGAARKIITDLNDHRDISLTADSRLLLAVQNDRRAILDFVPPLPRTAAKRTTEGMNEGYYGLAWTPTGELVYASDASGNPDLWLLARDGVTARRLTADPEHDSTPSVSPDGRLITFLSRRQGGNPHIWRMDIDGSNQRQLTSQLSEGTPSFTPDGQWVVYAEAGAGIWTVPAEGGAPSQIIAGDYHTPSVSPDGKQLVCFARNERGTGPTQLALVPMTTGATAIRSLDMPESLASPTIRWTADSRALIYLALENGTTTLRTLPLDGNKGEILNTFPGQHHFNFARSATGHLALARVTTADHVVLIRDFR